MRWREHAWTEALKAVALCIGGLALMTLLSCGGVLVLRATGIARVAIDQPRPDPDDIQGVAIYSLIGIIGCAMIAGLCEVVRRRVSSRLPPA